MAHRNSTIVRSARRARLAALRASFGVLENVAPALSGRWAAKLWFTIPPQSRRPQPTPTTAGEPFELEVLGGRVTGRVWGDPDGPVAYLVHGWGGTGSQLGLLVDPLVAGGVRVVAYDALSHGSSGPGPSGPRGSTAIEFAEALGAVAARFGQPAAVVAHSLGGMATGWAMQHHGLRPERLVLIAPMVRVQPYLRPFVRALGGGSRTQRAMVSTFEARIGVRVGEFDLAHLAALDDLPPMLVLHDEDDPDTRWSDAHELVEAWPEATLVSTKGLGHNRIVRDPGVVAEVAEFVAGASSPPRHAAELLAAAVGGADQPLRRG